MSFFDSIDRISYGKIISLGVFLALLFGVPATVLLVQQQTQIRSRAYQKPEYMVEPKPSAGPIPVESPQVGRVFPWVGKVGDIVWIQGFHFGNNPAQKSLKIGGVTIKEENIAGWQDNQIQAIIPVGVVQGGIAEVQVGNHPVSQSLPMVLYDRNAKIKLHKQGNVLVAENGGQIAKVKAWTGDENTPTEMVEGDIKPNPAGTTPVFDTAGKPMLTLLLFDTNGNILPYYVDPIEFGF
ncbi:hypothetical protein A2160_00035 [Candidatus Beckwithbacteria bacterium RBG_13_42_9]|uniref:IPT/TIG domain-containing protein n=1 Tax=Candidatus Beckwithbacteria bacterium RBG_13_42_9 TaxID=1797457 RepID=A0A1F5E484_9BACT|nr:MAG: hypothetical protein A2160_00035 [Candidatus Beckwithbacteria bacterium RBG_13_42_9]